MGLEKEGDIGVSEIFGAAMKGPQAIAALKAKGGNLDTRDENGERAVDWAIIENEIDALAALLEAGASASDGNPVRAAVWRRKPGLVAALIAAGADPAVVAGEDRVNALHIAVEISAPVSIVEMLANSAALEGRDVKGRTPLIALCDTPLAMAGNNDEDNLRALFEAGVDKNATDNEGRNAMDAALENRRERLAWLLSVPAREDS